MKTIVVNVLLTSIFCCFSINRPILANSSILEDTQVANPQTSAAKAFIEEEQPILSLIFKNLFNRVFYLENQEPIRFFFHTESKTIFDSNLNFNSNYTNNQSFSLDKLPYTYQKSQSDLVLGFQNTFWPSHNNQKYWGVTTVEHWGEKSQNQLNLPKLNYTNAPPTLSKGDSILTVSGGGNNNLASNSSDPSGDFEEFRGGVAFHRGVSNHVTMGVGFVYEDLLIGFSQITLENKDFPLRTTISFLTGTEGLEIHSHVMFRLANNFIFNYYNDPEKHWFDFNWGLIPGLNLTVKGDSLNKALSTGVKIAIEHEYLSFAAKAELDNNQQWQWQINSQLGPLQFIYATNTLKSNSELNWQMTKSESFGVQCSLFFKYQTLQDKEQINYLSIWGGRLHSQQKIDRTKHYWSLDLGLGSGSQGMGIIAETSVALNSNLFLKLTYSEISTIADDTQVKFQLTSK
ncbi:MAG: hypothetical protein Tsb0014_33800 [Pleurocapsa sp.]